MVLHFNLIFQTNQFHLIPRIHIHLSAFENDFSVFSISWLCFNIIVANHALFATEVYWRDVVKIIMNDDKNTMDRLDAIVNQCEEYTEEQFAHKIKYATNGFYGD